MPVGMKLDHAIHSRLITCLLALLPLLALLSGISVAIVFALFCVLILIDCDAGQAGRAPFLYGFKIALVLFGWGLASTAWSITPGVTFITSMRTGLMVGAGLSCAALLRRKDSMPAAYASAFLKGAVITLAVLCTQLLPFGGILDWVTLIPGINFAHYLDKNINRGLCAAAVLLWPALLVLERRGKRAYALAFPILLLAGLMSMHSLSAKMGALAGGIIFYIMLYLPERIGKACMYMIVLALLCWPMLFHAGEPYIREHIYSRLPESSQHRIEIWHFAVEHWREKPLTGWGVDTSRSMPGGDEEVRPGMAYMPMHPHNATLQVLLEQGIIGYMLLTFLSLYAVRQSLGPFAHVPFARAVIGASITSYLIVGFSAFNLWQAWWIALGLIVVMLITMLLKRG